MTGFSSGFNSGKRGTLRMREEGEGETISVRTLIVSSGTLSGSGNGTATLQTGNSGSISLSGSDGQIAVFSGSSNIVGYDELTYDQTAVNVTGNIKAEDIEATNVFTGDLHMKNERGDWTIFEEKTSLIVQNNLTGKRFKLMMEEIED
jgi:hypothetical protein